MALCNHKVKGQCVIHCSVLTPLQLLFYTTPEVYSIKAGCVHELDVDLLALVVGPHLETVVIGQVVCAARWCVRIYVLDSAALQ